MLGLALVISCANKQQMALLRSDAGDRHSEQGAYEAAIAAYGEAIALDPKNPSSRISLGKVYAAMDRFDEASGLVRSAVELNPADGAAQALLGQLELARGRYPESLEALGAAVQVQPDAFRPAFDLALAHLGSEGLISAALTPGIDARSVGGLIDWDKAADQPLLVETDRAIARAVSTAPDRASVQVLRIILAQQHLRAAEAHRRAGDLAAAIEAYRAAIAMEPLAVESQHAFEVRVEYDEAGNISRRIDPNGDAREYAYDAGGRLKVVRYSDGTDVTFTYDDLGNLYSMSDATGKTSYRYDAQSRLTTVILANGMKVQSAYGEGEDQSRRIVYPDGSRATYAYDLAGRIVSMADSTGETRFAYNKAGELVERTLPNGLTSRYGYDGAGRPISSEHRLDERLVLAHAYELDGAGRPILQMVVTASDTLTARYGYDPVGRLVEERRADGSSVRHEYDKAGNRTRTVSSEGEAVVDYAYGRDHRLKFAGGRWFEYDANGNLVAVLSAKGVTRYAYDFEHRLVSVESADGFVRFAYAGDGRRWSTTTETGIRYHVPAPESVAAGGILMDIDARAAILRRNTFAYGSSSTREGDAALTYYLYDRAGGDPVATCDDQGNLLSLVSYNPLGQMQTISGDPGSSGPGFRGGIRDATTGLVYLQGRYYDPETARFLTPRSAPLLSLTRYENPYAERDLPFVPPVSAGASAEAAAWAATPDPFARVLSGVLEGRYRSPIDIEVAAPVTLSGADLFSDPRLPAPLSPTALALWGRDLRQPGLERLAVKLPHPSRHAGSMTRRATELAVAQIQERWRWQPGQRQELLAGTAGVISAIGGVLDVRAQARRRDVTRLDGFDGLFGEIVPQDSSMYEVYHGLITRAIDGSATSDEFANFLDEFPAGPWTPQVQLLLGRQLVREGEVAQAEELFERMAAELFESGEWGDEILMAKILVGQQKRDASGIRAIYAQLLSDFPGSEWEDDALYILGTIYQKLGRSADALEIYARFEDGFPESVWTDEGLIKQPAVNYLRQITRVTAANFDPVSRQLVLAGENDPTLPPVNIDDFVVVLRSIYQTREDPAVSIGTEASGIEGYKLVRYDGGTARSSFGMTMFQADYVLKTLSIGLDSMRTVVDPNLPQYKSAVDYIIELDDLAMGMTSNNRVWFVPERVGISRTDDGNGILIDDIRIVVLSESRFRGGRALQKGAERFAEYLTTQYSNLSGRYPSIRKLPELAKLVAIAKWMRDQRIPVDLTWIDDYEITPVETPEIVKASIASRVVRPKGGLWESLKVTLEGGVSFREPNRYEVVAYAAGEGANEALANRPESGEDASWTYQAGGKDFRAVALALGKSRRDGQLALAHVDLAATRARTGANLVRYYDSFATDAGAFGSGWAAAPYALRFRREMGAGGEKSAEPTEGSIAELIDRPNSRSESLTINSFYAKHGLRKTKDGILSMKEPGGGELLFDLEGRLMSITTRGGESVEYRYEDDHLVAIVDGSGREIRLFHDDEGRVVRAEDDRGNVARYRYDDRGNLIEVKDPGRRPAVYRYDANQRLVQGELGTVESFQVSYDAVGRVRVFQDGTGRALSFDYDINAQQTTASERQGSVLTRQYDEAHRMSRDVDAAEHGIELTYTSKGFPNTVASPAGAVEFKYDFRGNLNEIKGPLGERYHLDYGEAGLLFVETPDGRGTAFSYNALGDVVAIRDRALPKRVAGRLESYVEAASPVEFTYEKGMLTGVQVAAGSGYRFQRDAAGNVQRFIGPDGVSAEAPRDARGRIESLTDGAGRRIGFDYDAYDRLTGIKSEGGDFGLVYDEGGRLSQITGPDGGSTTLAHVGTRMQSVSFGDGSEVEYLYDERGRLVGVKDPLGGRRIYDFDESGRVVVVHSLPRD